MIKNSIFQFYPSKYKWLTENKKIIFQGVNLKTAYLIDLMHYFLTKAFFFKKTELNLWSPLLQKKYGSKYKFYILWLIGNGVIKIKSKWFRGKKSITYKFLLNIKTEEITRFHNTDKILLKKINQHHTLEKEKLDKNISYIIEQLIQDLHYIELDYPAAINELEREYSIGLINYSSYTKNLMTLDSIHNNDIYWNFDKFGRLHTNFTILKRNIRNNFLTINGQKIDEVDIPNSQPLFLAKILQTNKQTTSEFNTFINAAKTGTFYDSFNELDYCRKDIKKFVYKIFFDRNYSNEERNLKFRKIWPELWIWIKNWKIEHGNHASLAWELQRLESDLIFKQVCIEIKHEIPNTPIFTVHDAIFFQHKNKNKIQLIFQKHLDQVLI